MATRMVKIMNMVNSSVSVKEPTMGVNRLWVKRGQVLPIPFETVEQLLWNTGFKHMLDSGILYIDNMKDKQDLGLESMDAKEPENLIALNTEQMDELLNRTSLEDFKVRVQELPRVQVDNLIEYAVEKKTINGDKNSFLKDLTGKDVMRAISTKDSIEKEEKAERKRRVRSVED